MWTLPLLAGPDDFFGRRPLYIARRLVRFASEDIAWPIPRPVDRPAGQGSLRFPGFAEGSCPGRGRYLHGLRAQEQPGLCRLRKAMKDVETSPHEPSPPDPQPVTRLMKEAATG